MKIKNGIYVIIDPSIDKNLLFTKLNAIKQAPIVALQIWDNFKSNENQIDLVNNILKICQNKDFPIIINNKWELLNTTELNGVHFDKIPENIDFIKKQIKKDVIMGVTCNNDLNEVQRADKLKFDYISFCSIFPSSTANSCELVSFEIIKKAANITSCPIFLAGGIKPENVEKLKELNYSGIAIVSGIMNAENPLEEIKKYEQKIKTTA